MWTLSPQLLQKLYRHSDLKTTIGYQSNFIHKDLDGALSDVLDFQIPSKYKCFKNSVAQMYKLAHLYKKIKETGNNRMELNMPNL